MKKATPSVSLRIAMAWRFSMRTHHQWMSAVQEKRCQANLARLLLLAEGVAGAHVSIFQAGFKPVGALL